MRAPRSHADSRDPGDGDDASAAVSFDPFADLLLGLIAILVPVISLLLASGAGAPRPAEDAGAGAVPLTQVTATAFGLRVDGGGAQPLAVPLAGILDDEALARRLRAVRDRGEPLLLDIAADGLEAAFSFEAVAARHGPALIRQRRLPGQPRGRP